MVNDAVLEYILERTEIKVRIKIIKRNKEVILIKMKPIRERNVFKILMGFLFWFKNKNMISPIITKGVI